jgi:hypothetical protein
MGGSSHSKISSFDFIHTLADFDGKAFSQNWNCHHCDGFLSENNVSVLYSGDENAKIGSYVIDNVRIK